MSSCEFHLGFHAATSADLLRVWLKGSDGGIGSRRTAECCGSFRFEYSGITLLGFFLGFHFVVVVALAVAVAVAEAVGVGVGSRSRE